jgi:hypothetical protein
MKQSFSHLLKFVISSYLLHILFFCTFLFRSSLSDAILLFFLWWSFWVICTPFFARPKKIARLLHAQWGVKTAFVGIGLWLAALAYNIIALSSFSHLYNRTFFTSALSMIIARQVDYWPLLLCCGLNVVYHALVDLYSLPTRRAWYHHLGFIVVIGYFILFFHGYYNDFVILFTIRS